VIPPGGEGEIKVTLKPKGTHPTIHKQVTVHSNDPAQPQFALTMKGTLLVDMVAQPPFVSIFNLAPGEAGTSSFSLERSEGSTATVKSVRVEDTKSFSVREIDTAPGALATWEVRFAGRDEPGTSSTNVIVETTGEHSPQLTVGVRANAATNLTYPKRLAIVRASNGAIERSFRITTRRGDPPKIGKIKDPDGMLDIEVHEPDGPAVEILVRLRADKVGTEIDEQALHPLLVPTDDPDEPELELEYQFRLSRGPTRAAPNKPVRARVQARGKGD
jgi:hypothetical protein